MTTVALVADVHANAPALSAALAACDSHRVGVVYCAGDIVGYNAMAREAIAIVRERGLPSVHGNHDLMVVGRLPLEGGPRARRAVPWTRGALGADDLRWLAALPAMLRLNAQLLCTHAALRDSRARLSRGEEWRAQADVIRRFDDRIRACVHGHSHIAGATRVTRDGRVETLRGPRVRLDTGDFWFINPGSVGEPRDGDWRASFAILEWPGEVTFHRARFGRGRVAFTNARRFASTGGGSGVRVMSGWMRAAAARLAAQ